MPNFKFGLVIPTVFSDDFSKSTCISWMKSPRSQFLWWFLLKEQRNFSCLRRHYSVDVRGGGTKICQGFSFHCISLSPNISHHLFWCSPCFLFTQVSWLYSRSLFWNNIHIEGMIWKVIKRCFSNSSTCFEITLAILKPDVTPFPSICSVSLLEILLYFMF